MCAFSNEKRAENEDNTIGQMKTKTFDGTPKLNFWPALPGNEDSPEPPIQISEKFGSGGKTFICVRSKQTSLQLNRKQRWGKKSYKKSISNPFPKIAPTHPKTNVLGLRRRTTYRDDVVNIAVTIDLKVARIRRHAAALPAAHQPGQAVRHHALGLDSASQHSVLLLAVGPARGAGVARGRPRVVAGGDARFPGRAGVLGLAAAGSGCHSGGAIPGPCSDADRPLRRVRRDGQLPVSFRREEARLGAKVLWRLVPTYWLGRELLLFQSAPVVIGFSFDQDIGIR